jgi:macrolide transport system ATP-binding/permease protein
MSGWIIEAEGLTQVYQGTTGAQVMQSLAELAADGRTILVITHDVQVAAYARRTLRMRDAKIAGAVGADR